MPPEVVRRLLELGRAGPNHKLRAGAAGNRQRRTHGALVSGLYRFSAPAPFRDYLYHLQIVSEQHSPFVGSWSMLATSFALEGKWLGRLTVCNPRRGRGAKNHLRFLETLLREVGPAVYSKYLVARLRSRVQVRERVRLVQELHDGFIQSLMGLEMQLALLQRTQTSSWDPPRLLKELRRLQGLLHNEIASVREEMQRIKPMSVEPSR